MPDVTISHVTVRESPIQGLGVFAAGRFRAGQRIRRVNIVREITDDAPLREEAGERVEHCSYPDGRVLLWGFPDRHVNHSCSPNAYEREIDGALHIYAIRDIGAGEEITFDYNVNISVGTSWPCNCGARRCGGTVLGEFFDLPVARQIEYLPLLAGWFVERHRGRIDALSGK